MQADLFGNKVVSDYEANQDVITKINGLKYIPKYIGEKEEQRLVKLIDGQPWLNDLTRRVQHYGYKYDYRARKLDSSFFIDDLPNWLVDVSTKISEDYCDDLLFDQVIVNEYITGQGIAAHIDCEPCFDDSIVSVSLLSDIVMQFNHKTSTEKQSILLERGSMLIISGESRYDWYHSIPVRKSDHFNNLKRSRSRRVSLTFRKVVI